MIRMHKRIGKLGKKVSSNYIYITNIQGTNQNLQRDRCVQKLETFDDNTI